MPRRILCLHGRMQSASIFSTKISGARRKLERSYELDFLDGPIIVDTTNKDDSTVVLRAWWNRDDNKKEFGIDDAIEYVQNEIKNRKPYDAIIGFSQGGTLAAALSTLNVSNVRAVITAGAPYSEEALRIISNKKDNNNDGNMDFSDDTNSIIIPKLLHFAGENDKMVPIESTRELCNKFGNDNGSLVIHEKGHLFPTRSAHVTTM
eukprot:CAMPEP_0194168422 /NCGR_PEP_ID=MMETSP0154-20130528/3399_1 /TAXON_ID=1049557 /ORGANISM="Thalassiothrix antarctica, Strain L6-D1" /LENGTH=205 /DNA_ID=CAMNT_0038879561 /DNA_START=103 /DNA_END=717 /DNA_ORIENTATION=-